MRLGVKVFLRNALLLATLGVCILLVVGQLVTSSLREEQTRQGLIIGKNLSEQISDLIVLGDFYRTELALSALRASEPDLEYVLVTNLDGLIFASTFTEGYPPGILDWNPTGKEAQAIQLLKTEVGFIQDVAVKVFEGTPAEVHLGLKETRLAKTLQNLRNRIILSSGLFIIIAWLLSSVFVSFLTKPIRRLVLHTEKLARGEYGLKSKVYSSDEIGELTHAFNNLSSELESAQQQIKENYTQMLRTEKLSALGRLSAGLAHEIRNPLTSIKVLFEAFRENPVLTREDMDVVLAAVTQMDRLLHRFLAYTKIEEDLQLLPVDINDIIIRVMQVTEFERQRSDIKTTMNLEEGPPVLGDQMMLEQVFLNLVINAMEAMPAGGLLEVASQFDGEIVKVRISDQGCGIPEDVKDKVFEPFFTTKEEGTGLGLSIVYNIVQLCSGDLDFSCDDQGCTFVLSFSTLIQNDEKVNDFRISSKD